jgi:hypothetical protein
MEWTLEHHDPLAARSARYIVGELEVHPIVVVEALERSPHLVFDSGYMMLEVDRRIHFPAISPPARMSLPVFLFHLLFGHASGACYVWSRLGALRRSPPDAIRTTLHSALFIVGQWFADISSNPPLLDSAMFVGRPDLRVLVSRLAFLLRCATMRMALVDTLVSTLLQPWVVHPIDPFWADLCSVVVGADVPLALTPPGSTMCSFKVNGTGIICCPSDKLLIAAVLLLSTDHAYLRKCRDTPDTFCSEHGIPKPLQSFMRPLLEVITAPVELPSQYATHDC